MNTAVEFGALIIALVIVLALLERLNTGRWPRADDVTRAIARLLPWSKTTEQERPTDQKPDDQQAAR